MSSMPKALSTDFAAFALYAMYEYHHVKLTPIQIEICQFLQWGWGDPGEDRLLLAYRGIGKTTLASLYMVWWLYSYPNELVLFIGNDDEPARGMGMACRKLVDTCPLLADLRLPEGEQGVRQRARFDVRGRSRLGVQNSWTGLGFGSRELTGKRAGLIVLDDWETAAEANSHQRLQKQLTIAHELWNIQSEDKPHWHRLAMGTYHADNGFWTKFQGDEFNIRARLWPAMYPDPDNYPKSYFDKLSPLVKRKLEENPALKNTPCDRLGEKVLKKKPGGITGYRFRMQFQMDTSLNDSDTYPLRCHDLIVAYLDANNLPHRVCWSSYPGNMLADTCPGRGNDRFFLHKPIPEDMKYSPPEYKVMYVDTSGAGADEMVWVYASCLRGYIFVIDFEAYRSDQKETRFQRTAEAARRHGVQALVMENNNNSAGEQLMTSACIAIKADVDVRGKHTVHKKQDRILNTMSEVMSQHRLVINHSLIAKDKQMSRGNTSYQLFHQLTHAQNERNLGLSHDDRLDALAGAVELLIKRIGVAPHIQDEERENYLDNLLRQRMDRLGVRKTRNFRNRLMTSRRSANLFRSRRHPR